MGQHADDTLIAALDDQFAFEDFMDGSMSPQEAYERGITDELGRFQDPVTLNDVIRTLAAQRESSCRPSAQYYRLKAERDRQQYHNARRKIALTRKRF